MVYTLKLNENDFQNILNKINSGSSDRINACGYCRFSSDHQREESIEAQQRIISEYAEKSGYNIVKWYCDRALSGKTMNRPDFQRMLKDMEDADCPFKAIICHKLDRISRSAADALKIKDILCDYGIQLVSTVERVQDDANGKLLYGIMSTINQYYIDNLSNEVLKGLKTNALHLLHTGGIPALGYKIVDKKLAIEESEAVIVRKIFQMAADGYGYNTIIKELNACGYRTKAGRPFGKNSLYDLMQNEKYKGVYTFNKCSKRTSQNRRNYHRKKDESEIIRIEGGCPAIVSADLWERANASRKILGKITSNAKTNYLLSGLMYCGECGAKMHGNRRHNGRNIYNTYRCNRKYNQMTCTCREIRADILENFVIDNLMEYFFNPEVIDIITEEVNRKIREQLDSGREDIQHAKNALTGLKLARNNLTEAIAQTGYNQTIADKLKSVETQIAEYEAVIENDEHEKKDIQITREQVEEKIKYLKDHLLDTENAEQAKILLRSYIDRITVDNNSVKVALRATFSFYYNGMENEVSFSDTVIENRKNLEKKRVSENSQKTLVHRNPVLFLEA